MANETYVDAMKLKLRRYYLHVKQKSQSIKMDCSIFQMDLLLIITDSS